MNRTFLSWSLVTATFTLLAAPSSARADICQSSFPQVASPLQVTASIKALPVHAPAEIAAGQGPVLLVGANGAEVAGAFTKVRDVRGSVVYAFKPARPFAPGNYTFVNLSPACEDWRTADPATRAQVPFEVTAAANAPTTLGTLVKVREAQETTPEAPIGVPLWADALPSQREVKLAEFAVDVEPAVGNFYDGLLWEVLIDGEVHQVLHNAPEHQGATPAEPRNRQVPALYHVCDAAEGESFPNQVPEGKHTVKFRGSLLDTVTVWETSEVEVDFTCARDPGASSSSSGSSGLSSSGSSGESSSGAPGASSSSSGSSGETSSGGENNPGTIDGGSSCSAGSSASAGAFGVSAVLAVLGVCAVRRRRPR